MRDQIKVTSVIVGATS